MQQKHGEVELNQAFAENLHRGAETSWFHYCELIIKQDIIMSSLIMFIHIYLWD